MGIGFTDRVGGYANGDGAGKQSEIRKYRDVYRLYEFPRRPNAGNDQLVSRKRDPSARMVAKVAKKSVMDSVP